MPPRNRDSAGRRVGTAGPLTRPLTRPTFGPLLALALALAGLPACTLAPPAPGSAPSGPYWGADATLSPGWRRLGKAAVTAAADPFTWLPAAAAAGLQIGGADEAVSDWARRERPLFGSRETAEDASDWLRIGSYALYAGAGLAAPAPRDAWLASKAKGFAVGGAALLTTWGLTEAGKAATGRARPRGDADDAFPSNHASMTAAAARLTRDTLTYYSMPPYDISRPARVAADVGLAGLALATGWARVEAGRHYPADVLAGMALGNFVAVFATEAFLAPLSDGHLRLGLGAPAAGGMTLQLSLGF